MSNLTASFKTARRCSIPLVAVRTPDPANALRACVNSLNGKAESGPLLHWDVSRGLEALNKLGEQALSALVPQGKNPLMATARPADMLALLTKVDDRRAVLPPDAIIFMENAHRFWDNEVVVQCIWNLRDRFKLNGQILVMFTPMSASLPQEIRDDVFVVEEGMPTEDEIKQIVKNIFADAEMPEPKAEVLSRATDALLGLSGFTAEQVCAASMTAKGLDIDGLWERKRQVIRETPGLSVQRGGEKFSDVEGLENMKKYQRRVINGKVKPDGVLWMDEIEKMIAGAMTDSTGVKGELTGILLTWMEDKKIRGELLYGQPGSGKSLTAKATANEIGGVCVKFDIGAMQNALVGASGDRFRTALARVDAMLKAPLVIATSNNIDVLPTELRSRFKLGTFFFDLPTAEEREQIWQLYEKKYGVVGQQRPNDKGWTGREIEECCRKADDLNMTLLESAEYIVPVAEAKREEIEKRQNESDGRYLSASAPGKYRKPGADETQRTKRSGRKLNLVIDEKAVSTEN